MTTSTTLATDSGPGWLGLPVSDTVLRDCLERICVCFLIAWDSDGAPFRYASGQAPLKRRIIHSGSFMVKVYRSKTDTWLLMILAAAVIASLVAAAATLTEGSSSDWPVAVLTAVLGAGLPVWVVVSTRYTLGQGLLIVQSGPFKWRIPVAEITRITPSSNPISSPALSLDRLRIDYGRGKSLLISPRDKDQFIHDVENARHGA